MWFNVLGFWMVGFTMGWALTFKAGLGLSGIWLGILGGVTTTGALHSYKQQVQPGMICVH